MGSGSRRGCRGANAGRQGAAENSARSAIRTEAAPKGAGPVRQDTFNPRSPLRDVVMGTKGMSGGVLDWAETLNFADVRRATGLCGEAIIAMAEEGLLDPWGSSSTPGGLRP